MYLYSMGYTGKHIQTENERNIIFHPFTVEIGDFVFRIKAKNAFYYSPTISPVRLYKYTFFVQYYALIKSIISFKYKDPLAEYALTGRLLTERLTKFKYRMMRKTGRKSIKPMKVREVSTKSLSLK